MTTRQKMENGGRSDGESEEGEVKIEVGMFGREEEEGGENGREEKEEKPLAIEEKKGKAATGEEKPKEEEDEAQLAEEGENIKGPVEEQQDEMKRMNGTARKGVRFRDKTEEGTDEMAQLEEYEQKLRRNTKEALQLVDRLCELQQGQQTVPSERIAPVQRMSETHKHTESAARGELGKALAKGLSQMGQRAAVNGQQSIGKMQIGEGSDFDVESVSLSSRLLQSPSDCVLLPGHTLLLVDSELGLSLVSLQTRQLIKNICPPVNGQWRNAQCACLGGSKDGQGQSVIYVLLEHRRTQSGQTDNGQAEETTCRLIPDAEFDRKPDSNPANEAENTGGRGGHVQQIEKEANTEYAQFIARFSLPEMELIDRIEAPNFWWLREHVVTQCRLCFVLQTECLYLAANTPNQGFLYELNIRHGKWTECAGTKRFRNYSDLHPFAVVGPVTELLLVETNRCYVQLVSVYGSNIVHERMLGLCERPGSLCVDERGNLFVFDRANSKVGLYSRTYLEKMCDVALVERANCRLSARDGVLAVMCGLSRELKLHRYSEEQCRKEQ